MDQKPKQEVKMTSLTTKNSAEELISQAINKNVPVGTMERLLAMRRELKAEYAKGEYDRAMAEFQSEFPIIEKTKIVRNKDGTIRYKFAPIESIVKQVAPLLKKNGFSYSINTKLNGGLNVTCKVTHEAGHSEISEFSVPINKDNFMNEQQHVASASTFAKRYAFLNAFGIMTGDEDDDTASVGIDAEKLPKASQNANLGSKQGVIDILKPATDFQKGKIRKLLENLGMSEEWLEKKAGKIDEMKIGVASQVIEQLTKKQEKMGEQETQEREQWVDPDTGEIKDSEIIKEQ